MRSVAKRAATVRSAAVAAWIAATRRPTSAAKPSIDDAVAQLRLPDRMRCGVEVGHGEEAVSRVVPEDLGHRLRDDAGGGLDPGDLVGVALDRRLPIGRDLELRQGALDAKIRACVSTRKMSEETPPVSGVSRTVSASPTSPRPRRTEISSS